MSTNILNKPPSEGEEFLLDFFKNLGIKFETEVKIEGLINDSKKYRTADFYLPEYKVYVEFFGLWNNYGNEGYKEKKTVYRLNKIPCVYLYPENLGIIGYTFDKRLQLVLQQHNMTKELRKYKFYKLYESKEYQNRIGILILCILLLGIAFFSIEKESLDYDMVVLVGVVVIYQCYYLYKLVIDIFKRNKYSLDKL